MSTQERPVGNIISTDAAVEPRPTTITGTHVTLTPITPSHALELYPLIGGLDPKIAALWDYMPEGPYASSVEFIEAFAAKCTSKDPLFWAICIPKTAVPSQSQPTSSSEGPSSSSSLMTVGYFGLMRQDPKNRVIELGSIMFTPLLAGTRASTEALYLIMRHAFNTLHNRRLEWKCNSLNAPSRRAAERLGFKYEGEFRHHMIVKGRNRDTTWFSILEDEWDAQGPGGVRSALESWLDDGNFDADGKQRRGLKEVRDG